MDSLSWRERLDIYSMDDVQHSPALTFGVENTVSLGNEAWSLSMEELSMLFSKLCLNDKREKLDVDVHDECDPFIIRLKNHPSNLICTSFPDSWYFSHYNGPLVRTSNIQPGKGEEQYTKYLRLHSKPICSFRLNNFSNLFIYRNVGFENKCLIRTRKDVRCLNFPGSYGEDVHDSRDCTTSQSTEVSPRVTPHASPIGPLGHLYQRNSSFGIFFSNLLAKAGRLKELAGYYSNGSTFRNQRDSSSDKYVEKRNMSFLRRDKMSVVLLN